MRTASSPQRIVALGDSTTALRDGVTVYVDRLQARFTAAGRPVALINAGVRGDHSRAARERFAADVLRHRPHRVIIQLGINDAAVDVWADPPATRPRVPLDEFSANLAYFCDALGDRGTDVLLCTPNPLAWTPALIELYGKPPYVPDDPDGLNGVLKQYVDSVRQVAQQRGLPLIDVDAAMRVHPGATTPPWAELLLDGMHPNDRGHALVANLLWSQLCKVPSQEKRICHG